MKASEGRGFRLGDVMILVAATAVGCSLIDSKTFHEFFSLGKIFNNFYTFVVAFDLAAIPIWLCWTYAALAIRLRAPRPTSRRMARQPGAVACLAISICAPITIAPSLIGAYRRGAWVPGMPIPGAHLSNLAYPFAFVISGAWLALWLGGRWRPEPSAVDRFGRFLAFVWLALYVLTAFGHAFT
jgi:hypothetical protein